MKKIIYILLIITISINISHAQKKNIVNASISLRNAEKTQGEERDNNLSEAKIYIDEAFLNESTSNDPKMWNYRSKIYLKIAITKPSIDKDAIFKASEAYIKCLEKDKKGRVIVRKWTSEEDVLEGLVNCGFKLFNTAIDKYNSEDYRSSLKYYDAIFNIIPLDINNQLAKGNVKKETILYNSFFAAKKLKDNIKAKELLDKLIELTFNEPDIYMHMSDIYIDEEDYEKALEYLELGRKNFPNEQGLINSEINLYIKLDRTIELIEKLGEAIMLNPDNDLLYFNRATIYDQEGDFKKAEDDYKKALSINSESFVTNYNIGALYFNKGVEIKNKANDSNNDKTYTKLKKQAGNYFNKALPFLEKAFSLNSNDKNTLLSLKQLYYLKEDYTKSDEIKKLISDLD